MSLYTLYPARTPPAGWTCVTNKTYADLLLCPSSGDMIRSLIDPDLPTSHWSASEQAAGQTVATLVTLLLATVSGVATGAVLKYFGRNGSTMPEEAWYDGTCFLDTPTFTNIKNTRGRI